MKDIGHHKKHMQKKGYRAAKKQAFQNDRRKTERRNEEGGVVPFYESPEDHIEEGMKESVPVIKKMKRDFFH